MQTGVLSPPLCTVPYVCVALTCDANGVLYGAGGLGIFSFNTVTGQGIDHGGFPFLPSGDLTFRDGKLYCTVSGNQLVEVNIDDPMSSQVVLTYSLPGAGWGAVSEVASCDSTSTFITSTDFSLTVNEVYLLDFATGDLTYMCNTPWLILGAATPSEFLASDCSVRLDLDADDSSGAPGSNYLALPLCPGSSLVAAADTDATFYSGYRTDSLRVRLLLPAPDAPLEYLTAQASGSVSVAGQGTGWLALSAAANTAVLAANADFQAVLRSLRWHNDAAPFTPGPRTVEVVAFASNGLRDTAYAFISVPQPLSAGGDTSLALCADAPPFDLAALLEAGASPGGLWSPATAAGNSVFSPQNDASGVYNYVVSDGVCPADTATVSVSVSPLPVFSLGGDTAFCAGETLTLTTPGPAVWQDGTSAANYAVSQPGLYWAELTDQNGCRWRDSIAVTVNQPVVFQLFATSCFGKPYTWNNQVFTADTSVCATFTAANGCDSLNCLNLAFFYPALALDTSICAGQNLSWMGQTYAQSGIYNDTLLYDGCLTAVSLNLDVKPPVEVEIARKICEGDSLVFNGKTYTAPGVYPDTIPAVSGGCDSVVTLTLDLLAAPKPQITGATKVCTGDAAMLSAQGNFVAWAWSGGESAATVNAAAGEHSVTVTDANGCRGADTVFVAEIPPVEAVWDTASPLCHGQANGFIEMTGISGGAQPFVFQLNNSAPSNSAVFQNLAAGNWQVMVTDSAGCETVYYFDLLDPPALALDLGGPFVLNEGESYAIPVQINQQGQFNYAWSPSQGLSCADCANPVAMPSETTTYTLILENENGCTTLDSVTLRVLAAAPQVYAPNVFSPNGDNQNDFFTLFGNPEDFERIELLQVYDRWGELVFEGREFSLNVGQAGWDGTRNGKNVSPGVYAWYAEIRQADGAILRKSGDTTVVR